MEAQVAAAEPVKAPSDRNEKSAEQRHREETVKDLQLSRVRIANDLANATNPNHKKSLEAALAHLDKKIAENS
ncbi:MAG TPA: hypothetical protein VN933_13355 [Candidatus Eremiobacteraceae bacterium]|nr:hypothetical protein [Candidatus Eremiobacteraceae bacterium]